MQLRGVVSMLVLTVIGIGSISVGAATFNSPSFSINGSLGDSVAGRQTSTSYQMTSSGGESIAGDISGGSYRMAQGYTPQLQQSLQLNLQPPGQVLHLPFDEGTGTTAFDASVNNRPGAIANSAAWTSTGKVVGGLVLNGTNQYVTLTDDAALRPASFTMATWFKPGDLTTTFERSMVSNKETGGYSLSILGTTASQCSINTICFKAYINGDYRAVEASKSNLTVGTWSHIAASYDGSNLKLYIDGAEVGSTAYAGTVVYGTNVPLCIGSEATTGLCNAGLYINGSFDEFKYYNRAVSAEEVKAEYDGGVAGIDGGFSFNDITPGTSQISPVDTITQTDSPGYTLSLNQNNNLTSGGNTITPVSGSIASPVTWAEGTTKGLGFSLYGTNATGLPGTWNSGNGYAALPGSSTSFYTRTGFTGGNKDILNMRLRLDVPVSQPAGDYTNRMTMTGTMTP